MLENMISVLDDVGVFAFSWGRYCIWDVGERIDGAVRLHVSKQVGGLM